MNHTEIPGTSLSVSVDGFLLLNPEALAPRGGRNVQGFLPWHNETCVSNWRNLLSNTVHLPSTESNLSFLSVLTFLPLSLLTNVAVSNVSFGLNLGVSVVEFCNSR